MRDIWTSRLRLVSVIGVLLLAFSVTGCEDGKDGADGAPGIAGTDGTDGINCWDLNANGVADPEEDINGDGVVDVYDCGATPGTAYETEQLHKGYFTEHEYVGTKSCLNCHGLYAEDVMQTAHFKWEGLASNITGHEDHYHGKNDIINNFCVAVPSNEGRCTHCHTGYGYDDNTFGFNNPESVDCLVCHDQSGTYAKGKTTAGLPTNSAEELQVVAQSVAMNSGVPTNDNCIFCHAVAGGDDNVKHGDLALSLANTTREFDVHMGTDGLDEDCVFCHQVKKINEELVDHGIGGMPYHSVDEGAMEGCIDCHGNVEGIHVGKTVEQVLYLEKDGELAHDRLACQVCHIPAIARETSTKVEWYWSEAGDPDRGPETDPVTNRATYAQKKGKFVWAYDVRPTLLFHDGKWNKTFIGENDQWTSLPAVLGAPSADYTTPDAMIYPFKKMIGDQPADLNNKTILVPHLFGSKGGPNWYWKDFDWNLALQDGAAYAGQTYTGQYEFIDTVMYLSVNHEIAPPEQALGMESECGDCHVAGLIDWQALGWSDDPVFGGTRP